jgi:hypothetical protein
MSDLPSTGDLIRLSTNWNLDQDCWDHYNGGDVRMFLVVSDPQLSEEQFSNEHNVFAYECMTHRGKLWFVIGRPPGLSKYGKNFNIVIVNESSHP